MAEASQVSEGSVQTVEKPAGSAVDKTPKATADAVQIADRLQGITDPDRALGILVGDAEAPKPARKGVGLLIDRGVGARTLSELRDKETVSAEKYGKSLVNEQHKGKNSPTEHEDAQAEAYKGLQGKIDMGLVDPAAIAEEACVKLGVKPELEGVPDTYEGIAEKVNTEVRTFLESGHLNQEEFESITREIETFTRLYGEAYGIEDVTKAYELIRDNARKVSYQAARDKDVFSGSDHGTRHILDGNTKFAMQMVDSLEVNGVTVSPKDKVLIHQIMIDHDLGYTTGAAQADGGHNASKDHPLVSAAFIEANEEYYVDKFGKDGYDAIYDSVLNHSYPRLEYQSSPDDKVHAELIRGITSTVDSLGVTVETKTPEFFWNPDAMRTLLKMRLDMETNGGKVRDGGMERYKTELLAIADAEENTGRGAGYRNAVENFFTEYTGETTLGHFTGIVRNVRVEEVSEDTDTEIKQEHGHDHDHGEDSDHAGLEHKKLRLVVDMSPTEVYALIGNMFGDGVANLSFAKAMGDLGLDSTQLKQYARSVRQAQSSGQAAPESLSVQSENARVNVGNAFFEELPAEQQDQIVGSEKILGLLEVFHEVETVSLRTEINELLDQVTEGSGVGIDRIQAKFISSITEKTTAEEIEELNDLVLNLSDDSPTGEKDGEGKDITVSERAKATLKTFLTQRERKNFWVYNRDMSGDEGGETMMTQDPDVEARVEEKVALLRDTVPLVGTRIGRAVAREEVLALGFVIDRSGYAGDARSFLVQQLGVEDNHSPLEAAWAINKKVYQTNTQEAGRRIAEANGAGNMGEVSKLQAMQRAFDAGHNTSRGIVSAGGTTISLGATPEYWQSDWLKSFKDPTVLPTAPAEESS